MYSPAIYLLIAWFLIYLPHVVGGRIRGRMEGGYDNRDPRAQQAKLTGLGARTVAAHNNGFETFAPFAAASIVAAVAGVDPTIAHGLSVAWVVARALYIAFYLGDIHALRSICWTTQTLCTAGLFAVAFV